MAQSLTKAVDEFGALKAQIADLTAKANRIKARLEKTGRDEFDGELFRVTISRTVGDRIDSKKVRLILTPGQLSLVTVRVPSTRINCVSRIQRAAA